MEPVGASARTAPPRSARDNARRVRSGVRSRAHSARALPDHSDGLVVRGAAVGPVPPASQAVRRARRVLAPSLFVLVAAAVRRGRRSVAQRRFSGLEAEWQLVDNALAIAVLLACAVYMYVATGKVYDACGAGRVARVAVLAVGIAAMVLGYRFALFLLTLYTASSERCRATNGDSRACAREATTARRRDSRATGAYKFAAVDWSETRVGRRSRDGSAVRNDLDLGLEARLPIFCRSTGSRPLSSNRSSIRRSRGCALWGTTW